MITLQLKRDEFKRVFWSATGEEGDFFCHICIKDCDIGYICENDSQNIKCKDCQDKDNMQGCEHDDMGEHRHMKFIKSYETEEEEEEPEEELKGVTSSNE